MIPRICKRLAEVGFPDRRGVTAGGAGEVDPARSSFHPAPLVGTPAAGLVAGDIDGAATAGPLRRPMPEDIQGGSAPYPPHHVRPAPGKRHCPSSKTQDCGG